MSPRYEPDLTTVNAVIAVLDKGEYEFLIGEPKPFEKLKKGAPEGSPLSVGIRYQLTVAEGPEKGAKTFYTVYIHTPDALGFGKQFVMTTLGFPLNKEAQKQFDAQFKGSNWGVDTDASSVGDMWREPVGKRVLASVDVQLAEDGVTQQQKWVKFRPV